MRFTIPATELERKLFAPAFALVAGKKRILTSDEESGKCIIVVRGSGSANLMQALISASRVGSIVVWTVIDSASPLVLSSSLVKSGSQRKCSLGFASISRLSLRLDCRKRLVVGVASDSRPSFR